VLDGGAQNGEWERGLVDHYVMTKGRLPVKVTPRQH